jgi:hypothetical protein
MVACERRAQAEIPVGISAQDWFKGYDRNRSNNGRLGSPISPVGYPDTMEERGSSPWPDEGDWSSRHGSRARWVIAAAAVFGLTASFRAPRQLAALAWSEATGRPPLQVQRAGDLFVVDVQTLGEYMTSVGRIRLRTGDEVVWEVRARGRVPQIWTFGLRVGENSRVPVCGGGPRTSCEGPEILEGYQQVSPSTASFVLERGRCYVLEVWGNESWWSRASTTIQP